MDRGAKDETASLRVHGGRIDVAERLYPDAPRPWVDLSTGIAPVARPVPDGPPELHRRLPLAADLAALVEAARAAYRAPAGAAVLLVPGTELAIRAAPRLVGGRRVAVLGPTYGSHGAAWRAAGAAVVEVSDLPAPTDGFDTVALVNPNNPDGRRLPPDALRAFAAHGRARLVVDEAFADVAPDVSLLGGEPLPRGAVVLRSFGKFFGLAGLRCGFVVCPEDEAGPWRDLLGDWPLPGYVCRVAADALADAGWIAAQRARLAAMRARLDGLLAANGFEIAGGTDLFRALRVADGAALAERFARRGLLVRAFDAAPQLVRIGLPPDEAAWSRLAAACVALRPQS
jgi:cobalamin biosynthetic protein CobC